MSQYRGIPDLAGGSRVMPQRPPAGLLIWDAAPSAGYQVRAMDDARQVHRQADLGVLEQWVSDRREAHLASLRWVGAGVALPDRTTMMPLVLPCFSDDLSGGYGMGFENGRLLRATTKVQRNADLIYNVNTFHYDLKDDVGQTANSPQARARL